MTKKTTFLICGLILGAAAGVTVFIFLSEPSATQAGATRETAMLVDVVRPERGDFRPTIVAMGTVQAAQSVMLGARIEGQVTKRAPSFTPGGFVKEGEILLRIETADYENLVEQRRSDLRQARADLRIEMGRQEVAREEFEDLDPDLSPENRALVLRQPQLESVRARVEAAQAALDQAKLNLERTTVKAPFDAQVISRFVAEGSQISVGEALGELVGIDYFWVETTVPLAKLNRIDVPDTAGGGGAEVRVRSASAWPQGQYRNGKVYSLVGNLDEQTRLARLLVSVPDPLARGEDMEGKPRLILGTFLEAHIETAPLDDVIRLDRQLVRNGDTVWLMEDGALRIREVDIVFEDANYAYISEGISADARVVTTNLATVAEGAPLRVEGERAESGESALAATGSE